MQSYNVPRASDVTICADPDLDVDKCADVLSGDGSTSVHVVRFNELGVENVVDANDYLQEVGEDKLREALALAKPVEQVKQETIEAERQWPTPYDPIDPATIPARRWIYGRHYIRSNVSVLASAGGIGKTSMQTVEALAAAILEDGQKVPIQVRQDGKRLILIEGLHRLEACRALGEDTVLGILVRARLH